MKRLTISVPNEVAEKAQRAVDTGRAESVSGYFAALAEREPDWAMARDVVDGMIAEVGGLPDSAIDWARTQFDDDASATGAA